MIYRDKIIKQQVFPFWVLPVCACIIASFGILATYFTAVHYGHVKPFPDTDITHAAIHYPEYIIFRSCLIVGAILISVVMLIVTWWMQIQAEKAGVPPSGLGFIGKGGVVAGFLLCLSTASISDGKDMDWVSHVIGATGFFIVIAIVITICTENYIRIFRANPHTFVPLYSYLFKLILQVIILVFAGIYIYSAVGKDVPDWVGNAVEWTLTLLVILYIGSFAIDLRNVDASINEQDTTPQQINDEKSKLSTLDNINNLSISEQQNQRLTKESESETLNYNTIELASYHNINKPLNQQ